MFQKKTFILTALLLGLFIQTINLTWGSTAGSPPARGAHSYATLNGNTYMFGGSDLAFDNPQLFADTWAWSSEGGWSELSPATSPSARFSAATTSVDGQMYVFFGSQETDFSVFADDVWLFDPTTNNWQEATSNAPAPEPRALASAVSDGQFIYLFGGFDTFFTSLSDLWRYEPTTGNWTQLADFPGDAPNGHGAVLDGNRMLVFGGRATDITTELWEYNIDSDTWTQLTPTGGPPPPRTTFFEAKIGDQWWIFAGETTFSGGGGTVDTLDDVWTLDLTNDSWSEETDITVPALFNGTAAAFGGGQHSSSGNMGIVAFGGLDSDHEAVDTLTTIDMSGGSSPTPTNTPEGSSPTPTSPAATSTPTPTSEPVPTFEVVANNLNNPRGMVFGADGALYIAEAGQGGDGACIIGAEGEVCYGATGAITRVLDGNQEQIATGLPSLAGEDGGGASGAHDVAFDSEGTLHVVIGLGADPAAREQLGEEGANFGQLASVSPSGEVTYLADVAGYEGSENPDGSFVDSNPFSLLATANGFVASDSGGNSILEITPARMGDSAGTTIDLLTVFPTRTVEFPPGTPRSMEAVPTGMAEGPDGALYIAELTGFPFPVGGARVYRIMPDEEPEVYADGLTNILDIAFDSAGNLYVLEMATNGLLSGDQTGALIRVAPDGSRETIASAGLTAPTGMVIGPDNAIYISNIGPAAGPAHVIRINTTDVTAVRTADVSVNSPPNVSIGMLAVLALITGLLFVRRRKG